MARILLPDDHIPGVHLHLYERVRCGARCAGRSVRGTFFEHQCEKTTSGEREADDEDEIPSRIRAALGETEVGGVDCGPG